MGEDFLHTWVTDRASEAAERLALRAGDIDLTYGQLAARARERASALRSEGVGEGTIAPCAPSPSLDFAIHLHACALLGAAAEPQSSTSDPHRGVSWTIPAEEALCRLRTSGTSGDPRVVDLTRANFEASAAGSAAYLGAEPDDLWLCCLPFTHVAGISILTRAAIAGTGVVLHDGFDIERVAASFADDGITLVSLVPTQIIRLLDAGVDLSGPRAIIAGGAPVPAELVAEARSRGARIVESYGMTETCSQVTLDGQVLEGSEIRIDAGQILIRGACVAPTSATEDGWLRTGDNGHFEGERLVVEGRRDDVIITGGENVSPEVVEAVLEAHPGVREAAVIGRPDPEWGQAATAVFVPAADPPPDAAELRAWCAERLERHEVPKRIELANELPRTASGKLRRAALREGVRPPL